MQSKLEIILPWPPKSLSLTTKGSQARRVKSAEMYRYTCKMISQETIEAVQFDLQTLHDLVAAGGQIHVSFCFCPPSRRRADADVFAAFEPGRHGLADALGIDDEQLQAHPFLNWNEIVKPGGEVRVGITGKGPEA